MRDRVIMHIDMNAFYASVAQHLDPSLRNKVVAVAGDPERRSGIILAKSREAKAAGGEDRRGHMASQAEVPGPHRRPAGLLGIQALFQARPHDLLQLHEPGGAVRTRRVMDRCHGIAAAFRWGRDTRRERDIRARQIRARPYRLGGVFWNKVFAKLGSDTDPGDGIIAVSRDNYKEFAWPMPASEMIYVGLATMKKLHSSGYETIGDLAHAGDYFLDKRFGKIGRMLRAFARGEDRSPVKVMDPSKADVDYVIKGIGNGLTAPHDLECEADVKALVWFLSESVSQRLRESHFRCRTVSVGVRRAADFAGYSRQTTLRTPTCLTTDVANLAMGLIRVNQPLDTEHAIRAIHVRTTNLVPMEQPVQDDLFGDAEDVHRRERLDLTIDELRRRFGNKCVHRTVELTDEAMGSLDIKRDNTVRPVGFLR